jgi:hypothetical protein
MISKKGKEGRSGQNGHKGQDGSAGMSGSAGGKGRPGSEASIRYFVLDSNVRKRSPACNCYPRADAVIRAECSNPLIRFTILSLRSVQVTVMAMEFSLQVTQSHSRSDPCSTKEV